MENKEIVIKTKIDSLNKLKKERMKEVDNIDLAIQEIQSTCVHVWEDNTIEYWTITATFYSDVPSKTCVICGLTRCEGK